MRVRHKSEPEFGRDEESATPTGVWYIVRSSTYTLEETLDVDTKKESKFNVTEGCDFGENPGTGSRSVVVLRRIAREPTKRLFVVLTSDSTPRERGREG